MCNQQQKNINYECKFTVQDLGLHQIKDRERMKATRWCVTLEIVVDGVEYKFDAFSSKKSRSHRYCVEQAVEKCGLEKVNESINSDTVQWCKRRKEEINKSHEEQYSKHQVKLSKLQAEILKQTKLIQDITTKKNTDLSELQKILDAKAASES